MTFVNDTDSVKDYLKQIGQVPLLTAADEVSLAKRIEAGRHAEDRLADEAPLTADERDDLQATMVDAKAAKDHMIEANLRLVVSVAKKYTGVGLPFLDLIQEGNIGLMRAAEKFDYTRGIKFSTYATWWIRQGVMKALSDKSRVVRIPTHTVDLLNKIARTRRETTAILGRDATVEEVAIELGMKPERIIEVERQARQPVSLNAMVGDDDGPETGDMFEDHDAVSPADAAAATMLTLKLREVLATMSEREAGVLTMRFGLDDNQPKTLEEVGQFYGVTRERIRQLEAKAMAKVSHPSRSALLVDWVTNGTGTTE